MGDAGNAVETETACESHHHVQRSGSANHAPFRADSAAGIERLVLPGDTVNQDR